MPERLHKVLAHAGIGSRRQCEELIEQGRVSVDGKTVTEHGVQVDPRRQTLKVDGQTLRMPKPAYFLLNKPRGFVCTAAEDARAPRAIDLAPRGVGRLHTVGRLDKESEGLIILTNDGELTERLTHPRHDFPKTYRVLVKGQIKADELAKLKRGVWLSEGKASASRVTVIRNTPGAAMLDVELREGKNREIRRMLARVGHPVKELRRTAIGSITIAGIAPGKTRPLTAEELLMLKEATGLHQIEEKIKPGRVSSTKALQTKEKIKSTAPPRPAPPRVAPRAAAEFEFPSEPAKPRPVYVPDADGVIVVRRPPVRFAEEEE